MKPPRIATARPSHRMLARAAGDARIAAGPAGSRLTYQQERLADGVCPRHGQLRGGGPAPECCCWGARSKVIGSSPLAGVKAAYRLRIGRRTGGPWSPREVAAAC